MQRDWLSLSAAVAFSTLAACSHTSEHSGKVVIVGSGAPALDLFASYPSTIEPPWKRFLRAHLINDKCKFLDQQSDKTLTIVGLQAGARDPTPPTGPLPQGGNVPTFVNAMGPAVADASPEKLCSDAMRSFVQLQATAAKVVGVH